MNSRKSQVEVYLAISLGLFGFGLLLSGWHGTTLLVLAILFALSFLILSFSLRVKYGWLTWIADRLAKVRFGHLTLFLGLSSLAMSLSQMGYGYVAIGVFAVAYASLILGFIPYCKWSLD